MTTFAFVHGAMHGGWTFEQVVPLLEARGHRTVSPDLPIDDDAAGARDYAKVVIDALDPDARDVIVVGHSLGGLTVPVIASMRPVNRMVFLGAMVPVPGSAFAEYMAKEPDAIVLPVDTIAWGSPGEPPMSWDAARRYFYADCPEDVARAAWARLRTQTVTAVVEPCPIDEWPAVPSTYIVMTEDRAVGPEWSRRVARGRLGVEPIELPGDHSPFFSRPEQLAAVLADLA